MYGCVNLSEVLIAANTHVRCYSFSVIHSLESKCDVQTLYISITLESIHHILAVISTNTIDLIGLN